MKNIFALLCVFALPGALSAQESGVFLKLPMSARGAGTGDAFTALADEPLGAYYNPAGIAMTKRPAVSFVHHIYLQDITGDSLGLSVPMGKYVVGVAPTSFKMKEEPVYDSFGTDTGQTFGYQSMIVPVSIARRFGRLALGVGIKSYSEKLDGQSSKTSTFDMGAIFSLSRLRFGFALQNQGGKIFDYGLMKVQRAGVVYEGMELNVAADAVKEGKNKSYLNLGAEVPLAEMFRLRGGMRLREEFGGPTFGLGIKLGSLTADYAFAGYGDLGSTHKLGLSYAFGRAEKRPAVAKPAAPLAPNSAPALAWTGEENYFSAGLSTGAGNTGTDFTYRVKYSDPDGDSPAQGYPRVHILKNGSEVTGSPFAMSYISGENRGGAIYSHTLKLAAGNDYSSYFEARDSRGDEAAGAPASAQSGPLVAQVEAERIDGGVNVAIAEFQGKNVSQADASIVGDFLRTELVNARFFNIMDRNNMDAILAEQKFQNSGCTEQQCAVEMGKILNVKLMLIGALSKLLDTYYITVNVVDVETGKITASYEGEAANARELKAACQKIAKTIAGK